MKNKILFALLTMAAGSLLAAETSPKDDLTAAAKKLAEQNYSWKTTTEMANFSNTSEGKADKDGLVWLSLTFGDNTTEVYLKGEKNEKGAVKRPDQDWQSLAEVSAADSGGQGRGRFLGRMLRNFKAPAAQVEDLVTKTKEIKKDGDAYAADLTEAGAKDLLSFGGRRGANAPEPTKAKGSVKVWLKDGLPSKYELKVQGTININGEDRDIDRTQTIELKDIGKTKLEVPEEAKKKLS